LYAWWSDGRTAAAISAPTAKGGYAGGTSAVGSADCAPAPAGSASSQAPSTNPCAHRSMAGILLPGAGGLPQRFHVMHDGPDVVGGHFRPEGRHPGIPAAVPDLVEQHAVGIADGAPRIGEGARRIVGIGVRSVPPPGPPVTALAVRAVQLGATGEAFRGEGQWIREIGRVAPDRPAIRLRAGNGKRHSEHDRDGTGAQKPAWRQDRKS